jgi:hypothetical protein
LAIATGKTACERAARRHKITNMTKPIRFALIAALPLEFANLLLAGGSIQGLATGGISFHHFLSTEAGIMHLPLAYLLPLILKAGSGQVVIHFAAFWLLLSGYVDWAVLLVAIVYAYRYLTRKRSTVQN